MDPVARRSPCEWSARLSVCYIPSYLTNPQTLNLYSMVADDPESFADLDGHSSTQTYQVANPGGGFWDPTFATSDTGLFTGDNTAQNPSPANMTTGQFLTEEVKGVYDTTLAPIVNAVEHPIQTVTNTVSDFVEGVERVATNPKATLTTAAAEAKDQTVAFGKEVASGNPRAIGQAAGLVIDAFVATRAVQGKEIKLGDNLRIAPTGNRTGHPVGRFPHYHRRIVGPDGKTVPGGSMKWHRPWEP